MLELLASANELLIDNATNIKKLSFKKPLNFIRNVIINLFVGEQQQKPFQPNPIFVGKTSSLTSSWNRECFP